MSRRRPARKQCAPCSRALTPIPPPPPARACSASGHHDACGARTNGHGPRRRCGGICCRGAATAGHAAEEAASYEPALVLSLRFGGEPNDGHHGEGGQRRAAARRRCHRRQSCAACECPNTALVAPWHGHTPDGAHLSRPCNGGVHGCSGMDVRHPSFVRCCFLLHLGRCGRVSPPI